MNCFLFLLVELPVRSLLDKSSFEIVEKTSSFASVSL